MDFSSLSLHQTKRKEMDAQVKVLELEKALEQAKQQLYKLRKQHYQMAGEDAGWDQNVCFICSLSCRKRITEEAKKGTRDFFFALIVTLLVGHHQSGNRTHPIACFSSPSY